MDILKKRISDAKLVSLTQDIIGSFDSGKPVTGLPLGNLTSQLFCNVYMNEFDQFVKHALKSRYYIRYADDFVILSSDKRELEAMTPFNKNFLRTSLKLELHPGKVFITRVGSGVDFLGWVQFSDHRVLRNTTRKRIMEKVNAKNLSSYVGLLKHGDGYGVKQELLRYYEVKTKRKC